MKKNTFHGILYGASGSLWWGTIGVLYFKSAAFAGPIELVVHRTIWTAFSLIITTSLFNQWNVFFKLIKKRKEMLYLFITGLLIFCNWSTWIYAVVTNKIVDASFGYFIMPILSVFLGILFLKENYNKQKIISVTLVIISITYLLFNYASVPWVGLIVGITWSLYSFLRKKINVNSDMGLFVESLYISPLALLIFYIITLDGNYYFSFANPQIAFWLFLAGPMTVIPLFLFLKGVDLAGLGTSGMMFFIAPTGQFLLGIFYYNEYFDLNKLIGFIIIWIAVAIYLYDLSREKIRN
tara:strand:- start:152 stop:1036 length:885 start_codon:yes stop_codon:yes gene_type:complete